MIAWLNPGALALVALAGVPLVIHLLLRRRATRLPFPSIRFIAASDRSSVRMRLPSDLLLLAIRIAIVALSALAVARPLLLTDSRARTLGERTIRALVVDTSRSVDAARAREAATAETSGATVSRRFDGADLTAAIQRASAWLASAEPGLRELVVISDFQRGALSAEGVARVPAGVGVRAVRVAGSGAMSGAFDAPAVFYEGTAFARTVHTDDASTTVILRPSPVASGLAIGADPSSTERITRAIAAAGGLAPSAAEPLSLRFNASQIPAGTAAWEKGWTLDAARRLFASPLTAPLSVRASSAASGLVIDVAAPADSLAAARMTQAALNARFALDDLAEREPATLPQDVLDSWTRSPSPPDISAWRRSHQSDGRWFWLAAIALMVVETFLRRTRVEPQVAVEAHAA